MRLLPSQIIESQCNTHMVEGKWPKIAYIDRSLFEGYRIQRLAIAESHRQLGEGPTDEEMRKLETANELEYKGVKLVAFDKLGGPIISVQRASPRAPRVSS